MHEIQCTANYYAVQGYATVPVPCSDLRGRIPMNPFGALIRLAAAAAIGIAANSPAASQSAADFYRGKTITYNLAVPDGASWGLYARTFIDHLRKHIPGNPNI